MPGLARLIGSSTVARNLRQFLAFFIIEHAMLTKKPDRILWCFWGDALSTTQSTDEKYNSNSAVMKFLLAHHGTHRLNRQSNAYQLAKRPDFSYQAFPKKSEISESFTSPPCYLSTAVSWRPLVNNDTPGMKVTLRMRQPTFVGYLCKHARDSFFARARRGLWADRQPAAVGLAA